MYERRYWVVAYFLWVYANEYWCICIWVYASVSILYLWMCICTCVLLPICIFYIIVLIYISQYTEVLMHEYDIENLSGSYGYLISICWEVLIKIHKQLNCFLRKYTILLLKPQLLCYKLLYTTIATHIIHHPTSQPTRLSTPEGDMSSELESFHTIVTCYACYLYIYWTMRKRGTGWRERNSKATRNFQLVFNRITDMNSVSL